LGELARIRELVGQHIVYPDGGFMHRALAPNTPVSTTDNDEVFFRYQNGANTTWQCVYDIGNAGPTSTDSGITIAGATEYRLWITIDSSRIAHFLINGVDLAQSTALTDAKDFIPYIGVLSATDATAKHLYVRNQFISRVNA
jgi:hypothetical protein